VDWDDYWANNKEGGLYSFIASIYRKFIIKRALNHYAKRCFPEKGLILHAGCGSGQVDEELKKVYKLVSLDISWKAVSIYKKNNPENDKVVRGSIFHLPFADNSFDGVYNLGVMEHFSMIDIQVSLKELKRVLKKNGTVLIFWPPEFGISVVFLKIVRFLFKTVLNRDCELHPEEVSRLRSKKEAVKIFEQAGFRVEKIFFNILDFFTMIVIVAKKP